MALQPGPEPTEFVPLTDFLAQRAEPETQRRRWWPIIIAIVGGLCLLAVAAAVLIQIAGRGEASPAVSASPSPASLERPAPLGWSSTLAWHRDVSANVAPLVAANRVVLVNATGGLVVLDAETGDVAWGDAEASLPRDATLFVVDVSGEPHVVARAGDRLLVWPLDADTATPSRTVLALAPGAAVSGGGGRLLVSAKTGTWTLEAGPSLGAVAVPAGMVAMSAPEDGILLAAPGEGWSVLDDASGALTAVAPNREPDGAVGDVYPAWSTRGVVVAWWATSDKGTRAVGFYDARTGALLAQSPMATDMVNEGLSLSVATDRSVAAAGPLLANLSTGQVTMVTEGWATSVALPQVVFGTQDGTQKAVWFGDGEIHELATDTAIPWGLANSGLAIVVDRRPDGQTVLGALTRDAEHAGQDGQEDADPGSIRGITA